MSRAWWSFLLVSIAVCASAADAPSVTAFVDVNVVPMDRERLLQHQTVLVRGDKIESLGNIDQISIPVDARRVEGHGKAYLLPGLADMHTHVETADDATMYVANGVTTVLQMGGDRMLSIKLIRSVVANGTLLAPQILFALMIDGSAPSSGGWAVESPAEARAAVSMAKARGYDFIKVYNGLSAANFDAIVDEATKLHLAVVGHGVRAVGLPDALFKGQVMVAHAEEFFYTAFGNKPDRAAIAGVVEKTFQSGAYVTPNLSAFEAISQQWGNPAKLHAFLRDPRAQYLSPESRLIWTHKDYVRRPGNLNSILEFLALFTKALSDRGVPLLTGTDSPVIPGVLPGYSIHDDLRTLTGAGLTNFQALSAATRTPGEFVARYVPGSTLFGIIAAGTRADLILVSDNPLRSLDALRAPLGVMHAGRWTTGDELRAIMNEIKSRHAAELREVLK
jgi:Amidohydrolase family